jgi:hypothetical protein
MDIVYIICWVVILLYIRNSLARAIENIRAEHEKQLDAEIQKVLPVKLEQVPYKDTQIFLMWDIKTNKFLGQSEVQSELYRQVFTNNPGKELIMITESLDKIVVRECINRSEVFN